MTKARSSKPRRSPSRQFVWRDITLRIQHTRNYLSQGTDHLVIEVVAPKGAPLPITATGYRSHFINAAELKAAGGPVAFVTAWLDREAKSKTWQETEYRRRQGDLFSDRSS